MTLNEDTRDDAPAQGAAEGNVPPRDLAGDSDDASLATHKLTLAPTSNHAIAAFRAMLDELAELSAIEDEPIEPQVKDEVEAARVVAGPQAREGPADEGLPGQPRAVEVDGDQRHDARLAAAPPDDGPRLARGRGGRGAAARQLLESSARMRPSSAASFFRFAVHQSRSS